MRYKSNAQRKAVMAKMKRKKPPIIRVYFMDDGTFRMSAQPNKVYKNPVSAIVDASRAQKRQERMYGYSR